MNRIRDFKLKDRVKCLAWPKPNLKRKWYKGIVVEIVPSEWEDFKVLWEYRKNFNGVEFMYETEKGLIHYRDRNLMLIKIQTDEKDPEDDDKSEGGYLIKFQSTVYISKRADNGDGAYAGDSIIFEGEPEPPPIQEIIIDCREGKGELPNLPF